MPHLGRRALALTAVLALGAFPLAGCSDDAGSSASKTTQSVAASTPAAFSEVDPQAFAAALAVPGTVVLDVRTPQEFADGHLPNAVNLDIENATFDTQLAALSTASTYAVYCRSGNRSGAALEKMRAAGFTSAFHLGGGIGAWQSAGLDVVQ